MESKLGIGRQKLSRKDLLMRVARYRLGNANRETTTVRAGFSEAAPTGHVK